MVNIGQKSLRNGQNCGEKLKKKGKCGHIVNEYTSRTEHGWSVWHHDGSST